jgi:predicted nuclease of predicted toxin-antitoxin system
MKVLLDECTPRVVKRRLPMHDISTAQEMGWAGIKNGELLKLAETQFEVFITTDKNLRYQ